MRAVVGTFVFGAALLQAAPVAAQSEEALRRAFEGNFVVVKMDMPATHKGVDVHPDRDPDIDFSSYSDRVREFGIALREGERILVTGVKVKKKNIEFTWPAAGTVSSATTLALCTCRRSTRVDVRRISKKR